MSMLRRPLAPTTVRLSGQLGNHLFQFAAALGLNGPAGPVIVDSGMLGPGRRDLLQACLRPGTFREVRRTDRYLLRATSHGADVELVESLGDGVDERVLTARPPVVLRGYFNDERYFAGHVDAVRAAFRPPSAAARTWFEDCRALADGRPMVAVGLRQANDYADLGYVLPDSYYVDAAARLRHPTDEYLVVVFGDDRAKNMASAEQLFGGAELGTAHRLSPVDQLNAMSFFDELVIPNSTFSWWGAWLADRDRGARVLAPDPWVYFDNQLIPDRWTKVERVGGLERPRLLA